MERVPRRTVIAGLLGLAGATSVNAAPGAAPTAEPALVAHRAGNDPASLAAALASGTDLIEIDVAVRDGNLVAEHPAALALPATPTPTPVPAWPLAETWDAARAAGGVELDLKRTDLPALQSLVAFLATAEGVAGRTLVSSADPRALRAMRLHAPGVCRYLSAGTGLALRLLFADPDPAALLHGASVEETVLSEATVARLHALGLRVLAWTVHDPARAAKLTRWGVDGLATDDPALLAALGGGGVRVARLCPSAADG